MANRDPDTGRLIPESLRIDPMGDFLLSPAERAALESRISGDYIAQVGRKSGFSSKID
jgi:hypothetical protein